MLIRLLHELIKPCGAIHSNGKNLPVAVFCYKHKPIVVVEELDRVAIRKNFEDIFETMRKSSLYFSC